jgi:plasmid stabilization system protein ParE
MAEVRIGEEAEAEYAEALAWYAERSAKASAGFEAAFADVLEQIGQSPARYPECDEEEGFRFATLSGYPYSLIYRTTKDAVQIIAVAHARRRPGCWAKRG